MKLTKHEQWMLTGEPLFRSEWRAIDYVLLGATMGIVICLMIQVAGYLIL